MQRERLDFNTSFGWWACYVRSAHVQSNRSAEEHWIFVYADCAVKALDKLYKARGWKRNLTYDICKLTPEGQLILDKIIKSMGKDIYNNALVGAFMVEEDRIVNLK